LQRCGLHMFVRRALVPGYCGDKSFDVYTRVFEARIEDLLKQAVLHHIKRHGEIATRDTRKNFTGKIIKPRPRMVFDDIHRRKRVVFYMNPIPRWLTRMPSGFVSGRCASGRPIS